MSVVIVGVRACAVVGSLQIVHVKVEAFLQLRIFLLDLKLLFLQVFDLHLEDLVLLLQIEPVLVRLFNFNFELIELISQVQVLAPLFLQLVLVLLHDLVLLLR